jgi:hypothetical protein
MIRNYINLSNGIQAIKDFNLTDYNFIRIQSTHCEQKCWDLILENIDHDFLMSLALGYEVRIYDYSARKPEPRSVYQGLPFITYILHRIWFKESIDIFVKTNNCKGYFEKIYKEISQKNKTKIKYYRNFLKAKKIEFTTICKQTENDGKYDLFYKMLS